MRGRDINWGNWVNLATVGGVVIAAGGLIFTGIATYYSAAVAELQLDQARQDAEAASRSQASLLSFWNEPDRDEEGLTTVVVNRSREPVYGLRLFITAGTRTASDETASDQGVTVRGATVELGTLPPCTDLTISTRDVREEFQKELPSSDNPFRNIYFARVDATSFSDTNGQVWTRTTGTLQRDLPETFTDPEDPGNKPHKRFYRIGGWIFQEYGLFDTSRDSLDSSPIEECGAGS